MQSCLQSSITNITPGPAVYPGRKVETMEKYQIALLAERIIDIDFWGAQDSGATKESVMHDIENDPATVISYLLDTIDELQA